LRPFAGAAIDTGLGHGSFGLVGSGRRLVIFDEPTRGVDVGAIHNFINRIADEGLAVIIFPLICLRSRIWQARPGWLKNSHWARRPKSKFKI
jgi:hypothetical protein